MRKDPRLSPRCFALALLFAGLLIPAVISSPLGEEQTMQERRPVVLGLAESVEVINPVSGKTIRVRAKIDTGANSSSIDTEVAEQLGVDLDDAKKRKFRSALGREARPIVDLEMRIGGRTIRTSMSVDDRSKLKYEMLVGAKDLQGFLVDPARRDPAR